MALLGKSIAVYVTGTNQAFLRTLEIEGSVAG